MMRQSWRPLLVAVLASYRFKNAFPGERRFAPKRHGCARG